MDDTHWIILGVYDYFIVSPKKSVWIGDIWLEMRRMREGQYLPNLHSQIYMI